MSLNLKGYRLNLVFAPGNMRCGFPGLSLLAQRCVGIDVRNCKDSVIFVSKDRCQLKMIWADDKGGYLLTRRLDRGRFQEILARIDDGEGMQLTTGMFNKYFDGGTIQSVRTDYFQGS